MKYKVVNIADQEAFVLPDVLVFEEDVWINPRGDDEAFFIDRDDGFFFCPLLKKDPLLFKGDVLYGDHIRAPLVANRSLDGELFGRTIPHWHERRLLNQGKLSMKGHVLSDMADIEGLISNNLDASVVERMFDDCTPSSLGDSRTRPEPLFSPDGQTLLPNVYRDEQGNKQIDRGLDDMFTTGFAKYMGRDFEWDQKIMGVDPAADNNGGDTLIQVVAQDEHEQEIREEMTRKAEKGAQLTSKMMQFAEDQIEQQLVSNNNA